MSQRSEVIRIIQEYFSGSKKISELPDAGAISGTEYVEVVQLGVNVKTTAGALATGGAGVVAIVAGTNVSVDATDPQFPIVSATGGSGNIDIGTTVITGGTSTRILYNNGGVVGEYPIGTGVATALAVNVGSAGAFVTFNGAGGTPSSIVLTNATGLPLATGVTGTLPVANGGSGAATLTGLLQGNGTSAFTAITNSSTVGQVLRVTGASTYAWGALDLADSDAVTGILPIANGGSGSSSAVWWALTGTSTLTGTTTIANGGNTLTFSGSGSTTFNHALGTATGPGFLVSGSLTANAALCFASQFAGTITGRGTSNDVIAGLSVTPTLNNSTGVGISHIGLRLFPVFGGSITPANSISFLVLAGNAVSGSELIRGTNSSGVTRWSLRADGTQVWTTTLTGSDFGGTMSTNAANGTGHLLHSFQLSGSATTSHVGFGTKMTGGASTNATNYTYYSVWDNRSLVVNNTGFVGYGFSYQPVVTGTQSGTETLYAFTSSTGLWGVGTLTPAVSLDINGGFGNRDTANAQITSNQNDYAIGSGSSFLLNTDASRNITGITGGVNGKFLYVINNGSFNIVFTHQDASSTAANRIISSTAGNLTIAPNGSITLKYDATASRWRDIGVR